MNKHRFLLGTLLSSGVLLLVVGFVAGFALGGLTIDQRLDWSGLSAIGTLLAVIVALGSSAFFSWQQHAQEKAAQRRDLESAILRMGPTLLKAAMFYADRYRWGAGDNLTHENVVAARQCLEAGEGHGATSEIFKSGIIELRYAVEETIRETGVKHPRFRSCLDHTSALARLVEEEASKLLNHINWMTHGAGSLPEGKRNFAEIETIEALCGRLVTQAWELKYWTMASDYGQVPDDSSLYVPPIPKVTTASV